MLGLYVSTDFQSELLYLFLTRHFLDHTAETSEFLIKPLISSLDINDIIHDSDAFCRESCDTQCRSGS